MTLQLTVRSLQLIHTEVYPSSLEVSYIQKKAESKRKTHEKHLGRRREKYQAAHGGPKPLVESDEDDDDDVEEEVDTTRSGGEGVEGSDEEPQPTKESTSKAGEQTRQQHVQELFGHVTDVSSSDSGNVASKVNQVNHR